MGEPRRELRQHKIPVIQGLGHSISKFMAHLAQQDKNTNGFLKNTDPLPNGDLQRASDISSVGS